MLKRLAGSDARIELVTFLLKTAPKILSFNNGFWANLLKPILPAVIVENISPDDRLFSTRAFKNDDKFSFLLLPARFYRALWLIYTTVNFYKILIT